MKKSFAHFTALFLLLAAMVFAACQTVVPETGRKQVNFLTPSEEAALGLSEFQRIKESKPISTNQTHIAQVRRVGDKLSKVIPMEGAQWEFVVFEDATPNAFALPGGKVGVHSGLFQVSQNDAGLAAVLGHEIAHVVARHSGERLSRAALSTAAVAGAGYMLNKKTDHGTAGTVALGAGAYLETQRHSRRQELEADQMGALYMARAGYDPRESVALWRRFSAWREQNGQSNNLPFLSSHPLDSTRISELEAYMPTAMAEYSGPR